MLKLRRSAEPGWRAHRLHVSDDAGVLILPAWYRDLRIIQISPVEQGVCAMIVAPREQEAREGAILMTRQEDVLWRAEAPEEGDAFFNMILFGGLLLGHTRWGYLPIFDPWTGDMVGAGEQRAA